MPRVRAILVDNTTGRLLTGVQRVQDAAASNVIAGKLPQTRTITNSGTIVAVKNASAVNLSSTGAFVTGIGINLGGSPAISGLVLTFKVGTDYATASTVATTTIAPNVKTGSISTALSIAGNQFIYLDVAYATPSGRSASKLQVSYTFFPVAL